MIIQHLYWPGIILDIRKEVTNFDTCQRRKQSNKEYGKLPDKLSEEITWNKIYEDLIGPYVKRRNVNKENLHLKAVMMIDPVTVLLEIS